jgi:aldehyde:ferredoxin oxidoreductase
MVSMPFGYRRKILHVDLTDGRLEVEEPPDSFYRKYMGGGAMGMYYILKMMPPGADALGPDNVIAMMAGVTTGAPISGQSRFNVNAKSPITGAIGDSQSGGYFPAALKFAGFDGIVVRGCSPGPVALIIEEDEEPRLIDASHVMGLLTAESEDLLKEEVGGTNKHVLQHGPAAERGVLFSNLLSMSCRCNGRTGMGLVMASKNLKAVVVSGKQKVDLADKETVKALQKAGAKTYMPANEEVDYLGKIGTSSSLAFHNELGFQPTRNYNEGWMEHGDDISGETMYDTILKKRDTCYACVVRCKRVVEITEGPYQVNPRYGGPEYETLSTFGSYCNIRDLAAIAKANELCNAHGVDTITCGATISFAIECFEKGIIGLEETGGLELRYGDPDLMLEVLQQIVTNSGALGSILSQGSANAAERWGPDAADCLVTVKKQELPAHMPQFKKALGLIYAVNPFGADHQSSEHDISYEEGAADLHLERLAQIDLQSPPPPGSFGPEKIRFAAITQNYYSITDCLELCQFVWAPAWSLYGPSELVDFVKAVTGWSVSLYELMRVGERRINMMRAFNAREGFGRKDDKLPNKFFRPLGGKGPNVGETLDREEFEAAIDLYYQMKGWDEEGVPTRAKMIDLGLEWVDMGS